MNKKEYRLVRVVESGLVMLGLIPSLHLSNIRKGCVMGGDKTVVFEYVCGDYVEDNSGNSAVIVGCAEEYGHVIYRIDYGKHEVSMPASKLKKTDKVPQKVEGSDVMALGEATKIIKAMADGQRCAERWLREHDDQMEAAVDIIQKANDIQSHARMWLVEYIEGE